MIVADTSLWIDHLRSGHAGLGRALERGEVAGHPWVTGELALGGARAAVLELLDRLPQAPIADASELRGFLVTAGLTGGGIGWVDAQLLAGAKLMAGGRLATRDRRLGAHARRLGLIAVLD